jgi:hypothetical protein
LHNFKFNQYCILDLDRCLFWIEIDKTQFFGCFKQRA